MSKRLRDFITGFAELLEQRPEEPALLRQGTELLQQLVARDDWLPDACALPDPHRYQQYLLHADSLRRFSVVSFVWGAGQQTPVHDHTVWGLIGMLRGAEIEQGYAWRDGSLVEHGGARRLEPGMVAAVSPRIGDVHRVRNAFDDRVSISIHVYGANIGEVKRSVYLPDGASKEFISGYSNGTLPNIWDLSAKVATP
jgi:predicted metal-dependent enzyme (double-stranded beta helix superfamily)